MAPSWFQGLSHTYAGKEGDLGGLPDSQASWPPTRFPPGGRWSSPHTPQDPGECPRLPIVATTNPPLQGSGGVRFPPYLFPLTWLLSLPGISLSFACLQSSFPHKTPAVSEILLSSPEASPAESPST